MRNQGIGKELLQYVEDVLKKRGCELIIADIWKSAEPFYRKLGWGEPQAVLLRKRLIEK
ncbi:GNAT family N-acetyltransferase [candidate division WOR-3 bacterium]|nr:GNAT family N-acetyltransferase [candidate division WOR-3 bacterium]